MSALRVLLLSEGRGGHDSQSEGIAAALASRYVVELYHCRVSLRHKWLRSLLRAAANRPWPRLQRWLLRRCYRFERPLDGCYQIIVGSGGNLLFALLVAEQQGWARTIYSGTSKGYPAAKLGAVVSVVASGAANNIAVPLPPARRSSLPAPDNAVALGALFIGGDGAGYHYAAADWQQLAAELAVLPAVAGWLLTTSRRTGAAAELLLRKAVSSANLTLLDSCYYSEAPRPVVADYLARASFVVVSEESFSMLAEAIYSGRPVYTFAPQARGRLSDNDAQALASYRAAGYLRPLSQLDADLAEPIITAQPLPDIDGILCDRLAALGIVAVVQ